MDIKALKDLIVQTLEDKNGRDIKVIDISDSSSIADYFIITTARNSSHLKALSDNVEEKVEGKYSLFVTRKEGAKEGRWAVLDYGDIIVHIFNSDSRDFYCLEKLWENKQGN